jgi:hypothetical protein
MAHYTAKHTDWASKSKASIKRFKDRLSFRYQGVVCKIMDRDHCLTTGKQIVFEALDICFG